MYHRIFVNRPGALGDFILTLPLIEGLRRLAPDGEITVAARGSLATLASGIADHLINSDTTDIAALSSYYIHSGDLVLNFVPQNSDAAPGNLGSATRINIIAQPPAGVHAARHYFHSLPALADAPVPVTRISPTDDEREKAGRAISASGMTSGEPFIAVHPGSGGLGKCWPAERFAQAIESLHRLDQRVLIIEGEADSAIVSQIRSMLGKPPAVLLRPPLRILAAVLGQSAAYLGNDSGVSHLAAAAGARCIALFGPTDPATWAPLGENVIVVTSRRECSPCGSTSPDCSHRRCLADIQPETVVRLLLGN